MDNVFVTLIPVAIGVAISPAPIIELILVLFSKRRVVNAIAFIVTLLLMTVLVLALGALGGRAADGETSGPSPLMGWIFLALGALLLVMGVKNWRNRKDTSEPAMFAKITGLGPAAVAFLAFGAVAVNPKNTVLLLTAGQSIGAASSPWLVGLGFVLVATLPYTALGRLRPARRGSGQRAARPDARLAGRPQPPHHGRHLPPARPGARAQGRRRHRLRLVTEGSLVVN